MESTKTPIHRKYRLIVLLLFLLACGWSWYLYSQTLGVVNQQYRTIQTLPSTDLSGIAINGYRLGQPYDGAARYGDGISAVDGVVTRLTFYDEYYATARHDAELYTNTITDNGVEIGPSLDAVQAHLGDSYQIVGAKTLRSADAFVYVDREHGLMLRQDRYYARALGGYSVASLQPLDEREAVAYPSPFALAQLLLMPLYIRTVCEGMPESLGFYIALPLYCLLFFAPVAAFISRRKKRYLAVPVLILLQWAFVQAILYVYYGG